MKQCAPHEWGVPVGQVAAMMHCLASGNSDGAGKEHALRHFSGGGASDAYTMYSGACAVERSALAT